LRNIFRHISQITKLDAENITSAGGGSFSQSIYFQNYIEITDYAIKSFLQNDYFRIHDSPFTDCRILQCFFTFALVTIPLHNVAWLFDLEIKNENYIL
jgi:hypothetical protein